MRVSARKGSLRAGIVRIRIYGIKGFSGFLTAGINAEAQRRGGTQRGLFGVDEVGYEVVEAGLFALKFGDAGLFALQFGEADVH